MRRRLLVLLSLLLLLMQPAALLHELAHGHGVGAARAGLQAAGGAQRAGLDTAGDEDRSSADVLLSCLDCGAFAALATVLPAPAFAWQAPPGLAQARPGAAATGAHGGTGAGYHARGPPPFLG